MNYPVLVTKKVNIAFTYKANKNEKFNTGDIVFVPFGSKEDIGVIWDKEEKIEKKIKIKNIKKKTGHSISRSLVSFINKFASYNLIPKGLVLKMCVGNENFFKKKENEFQIKEITKPKKFILSEEQKKIYGNLINKKNDFSVSVIQGITGSGKTLVYFEKIKDILKDNNQVLILFPEIFLTSQIEDRFVEYFGFKPFLWHSKITPKKKE